MDSVRKTFESSDQELFAQASGDFNPIHLDPVHARETRAEAPVVHGIHLLLWALDAMAAASGQLPPLQRVDLKLNRFIVAGETVDLSFVHPHSGKSTLILSVNENQRARISVWFGDATPGISTGWADELPLLPIPEAAENRDVHQMQTLSGRLPFCMSTPETFVLFPAVSGWLGADKVAALAATSCLVGMHCPGLRSIYSMLTLDCSGPSAPGDSLAFRVIDFDSRFHMVEMEVEGGGLRGIVTAFVPAAPSRHAMAEPPANWIGPADFKERLRVW